jgi:hypothetical protein
MERQTLEAYQDVFSYLLTKELYITSLMMDYEIAARSAARLVFPNVRLWGCHFHFAQVTRGFILTLFTVLTRK